MTQLYLSVQGAKEGVALWLPATPAEISEAFAWFDRLGVPQSSIQITDTTSSVQNLGRYIASVNINDPLNITKLNELAESIEQMDAHQHSVFSGALDAESVNGLDDVIRISKTLDQYILISGVSNDKELGGFLVESGYKNFPDYVQPYLDYAGIGREYYAERGGAYFKRAWGSFSGTISHFGVKPLKLPTDRIEDGAKRLQNVVIEHKDALDLIRERDKKDTIIYCDPP